MYLGPYYLIIDGDVVVSAVRLDFPFSLAMHPRLEAFSPLEVGAHMVKCTMARVNHKYAGDIHSN